MELEGTERGMVALILMRCVPPTVGSQKTDREKVYGYYVTPHNLRDLYFFRRKPTEISIVTTRRVESKSTKKISK